MARPLDLSIIVVSHNVRKHLERAIAAAREDGSRLASEIIVVDNASTDGSAAAVRTRFPDVTLVENADNRYYTAANNQGFAVARGRFVLVLNPDAEIRPGTLPSMLTALESRPEVGLASCRLLWPDGSIQRNCCAERTFLSLLMENTVLGLMLAPVRSRIRSRDWYAGWDRESEREVGVLPGSFLLARREVLDQVGGFDERLRLYFAEDDWCLRVRRAGASVRYLAVGAVIHPERASVGQQPRLARRIYFEDLRRHAQARFGRGRARLLAVLAWPLRRALDATDTWRGSTA